jgi:hypothetical protein
MKKYEGVILSIGFMVLFSAFFIQLGQKPRISDYKVQIIMPRVGDYKMNDYNISENGNCVSFDYKGNHFYKKGYYIICGNFQIFKKEIK